MTPDYARIRALFDELVHLAPEERERRIAEAALDDASRDWLRRLLMADEAANDLTARRAVAQDGKRAAQPTGWRIGAYVVDGEVGHGGMGNVYRAHRADGQVDQVVAIKVIRPERIDASTLARFRLERQVLAVLKHPNIATMLDAGELGEGAPYVVMEYIEGEPITDYANAKSLDLKQRLALFLAVCDAVAYAHNSLIVHRDLKPSNILVTSDGRPKLLDFGIAKPLLAQLGTFDVEETGTAQRFFSPYNVAPEQLRGEPTTVACDVYGLGVVLYELVAGARPFDFEGRTPSQVEAMIFDSEPVKPSRRASLASVPARQLAGDLDAIAMRCLRKAPGDRYRTVEDLAKDIANYLADRPVTARDGNVAYRVGRFFSRNRRALVTTALLIAVSGTGLYAYVDQQRVSAGQRMRADRMTALIMNSLKTIDPREMKGYDISAREVFASMAQQATSDTTIDAATRADLLLTIATIDVQLGLYKQGLAVLDQTAIDPGNVEMTQREQQTRTSALLSLADYGAARELVARNIDRPMSKEERTRWLQLGAEADMREGKLDESVRALEAIDRTGLSHEVDDAVRVQLGEAANRAGFYEKGETVLKALLAEQRQRLPKNHPDLYNTLTRYSYLLSRMGRPERDDEMLAMAREASGIAENLYGKRSFQYYQLAWYEERASLNAGDTAGALKVREELVRLMKEMLGENNPRLISSYMSMAEYYCELGRIEECDASFRKAIETGERQLQPDDLNLLIFRVAYADGLINRGLYAQAKAIAKPGLDMLIKYPEMEKYAAAAILHFIDALATYAEAKTAANADAARHWLAEGKLAMVSISTKRSMTKLIPIAAKLGIETP